MSDPSSGSLSAKPSDQPAESTQPENKPGRLTGKIRLAVDVAGLAVASGVLAWIYPPYGHAIKGAIDGLNPYLTLGAIVATAYFTKTLSDISDEQRKIADAQRIAMRQQVEWMEAADKRLGEQIKLARDEFDATHRPKLKVRNVTFRFPADGTGIEQRDRGQIEFYVVNVGSTYAIIIEVCVALDRERNPWPNQLIAGGPRYHLDLASSEHRILLHGESWIGKYRDEKLWSRLSPGPSDGLPPWHFVGYIRYTDARDTIRRVSFCLRYDNTTRRFVRVDDPDFAYDD
jgi:hypothetical protein